MNIDIELKTSLNTGTFNQDIKKFGEKGENLINTGIERMGGVTNVYETEEAFPELGQYIVDENNRDVSIVDSTVADYKIVKVDGQAVGQVSAYGIEKQNEVKSVDDVFIETASYTTCNLVDATITISKYDLSDTLLLSRTVTFTNLATLLPFFTSLSFVRYNGMTYADSMEWSLRLGDQHIILKESTPTQTLTQAVQSTSVLGTSNVNCSLVYNNTIVFAGDNGRVGSFDGVAWKDYNGNGMGTGVFNNGDSTFGVIGNSNIYSMILVTYSGTSYLVIGGALGRVGNWNGSNWVIYSTTGGLANSGNVTTGVISTDDVTAMIQINNNIVFGGSLGKIGSYDFEQNWFNNWNVTGLSNNATIIGAVKIYAFALYNSTTILVAGASGRVGNFKINNVWTATAGSFPVASKSWTDVCYGNGKFVAVSIQSDTTSQGAYSLDGITWVMVTLPAPTLSEYATVCYGNGIFMAISQKNSIGAVSTDGITWTYMKPPFNGLIKYKLVFGNGIFFYGGFTSTDGTVWTRGTAPSGFAFYTVGFGDGKFVAVLAGTSRSCYSTNGIDWTETVLPATKDWYGVIYGNGKYIATANTNSTVGAYSLDGITWVQTVMPSGNWLTVSYGNGKYVAFSYNTSVAAYSIDGITWTQTALSTSSYYRCSAYGLGRFVVLASNNTNLSNYITVSNTNTAYTTVSSATFPTNNATVIGANTIRGIYKYGANFLFFGGDTTGLIGTLTGAGTWYAYTTTTAGIVTDNNTLIVGNSINTMTEYNGYLVMGGSGGLMASITGAGVKQVYNSGLLYTNNATVIGDLDINVLVVYNSILFICGQSSTVNLMQIGGSFPSFYISSNGILANLLTNFNTLGYLYTYRYENGLYMINLVGNSNGISYTLDNATKSVTVLNCTYALLQVSSGKSRHITTTQDYTTNHLYDSTTIKASGLVGYTDFTNFSSSIVFPTANYTLGNGYVKKSQSGFGYADFDFQLATSSVNIFNYTPQFQNTMTSLFQVNQSNSDILINAYGKITNNIGVVPSKPFEFRVCWIEGEQAYLSCAIIDGLSSDTLGTMITNIGNFDGVYTPMIINDSQILYKDNGVFRITKIGKAVLEYIQKVTGNVFKINTITPTNILDSSTKTLSLGSIDFNNRMIFNSSTAAIKTSGTLVSSFVQSDYSNSVDTGDKIIYLLNPIKDNIDVIGYRIPTLTANLDNYFVDTYVDGLYSYSTMNNGAELIIPSKTDVIHVASDLISPSIGVEYGNGVALTSDSTIFLKPLYDGSVIGNDIQGRFSTFTLFGQLYLFDGSAIYAANVNEVTGAYTSKTLLCVGKGLSYISSSPTEITFLSSFDNSIYVFTGGRNLVKGKRFTSLEAIKSGLFNEKENSLILDTANTIIFVRDSIASLNAKKVTQTDLRYFSTSDGVVMINNSKKWQYTYYPTQTSTVVPLDLKTNYYGLENNNKSILKSFVITIYNEARSKATIDVTNYTITEDTDNSQLERWVVMPGDYNSGGYARLRLLPQYQRTLGSSLRLTTNDKIVLVSINAEVEEGEKSLPSTNRTV